MATFYWYIFKKLFDKTQRVNFKPNNFIKQIELIVILLKRSRIFKCQVNFKLNVKMYEKKKQQKSVVFEKVINPTKFELFCAKFVTIILMSGSTLCGNFKVVSFHTFER